MIKHILSTFFVLVACSAVAEDVAIDNARVVTLSTAGTIDNATILVTDGVIAGVGKDIAVPEDTRTIDAAGSTVTPGLFDSGTRLGLAEVESLSEANDYRLKEGELGAGFPVGLAINRFSGFIPMVRMEGVTRALVSPLPGVEVFAGQSAIMHLGDARDFLVDESNAVFVYLGEYGKEYAGGSRAKGLLDLMASLREADLYRENRRAYDSRRLKELGQSELDLQALVPVLEREKPLALYIDRAAEIESALTNLRAFDIRLVLVGGGEAWKVKEVIAERDVPVVLNPFDNLPTDFDQIGARLDNAAILTRAGIAVAYMTEDLYSDFRNLRQGAGISVANGMSHGDALAAITINPARIWGLDERYGSIEPGKDADIVIWDGDPLELTSAPTHVMIRGELVDMKSRQTLLRDRYSELGQDEPPFGYR